MRTCFQCGQEIPADRAILREDECPHCSSDLHTCRNCQFYDPAVSHQCAEPLAEWVSDKERANFCEYFVCADGGGTAKRSREGHSARERFNKLFRD